MWRRAGEDVPGDAPDLAPTAQDLVGDLARGRWAVFCHEWADRDGIDPGHWRDVVAAAAEVAGVDCEFVIVPRRSLTVVFNRAVPPDFEQVRASIAAVERHRRL